MKKPKIIPAYLNKLTYNERKYSSYQVVLGIMIGSYATYGLAVMTPFAYSGFNFISYKFSIYCILLAFMILTMSKISKYKKVIKLEPRVKQKKDDSV